jgi:hypothetical protein
MPLWLSLTIFLLVFASYFGHTKAMYADDPVTWCLQERIARYREQAEIFGEMANSDGRPFARNILMQLAAEFDALADGLQEHP